MSKFDINMWVLPCYQRSFVWKMESEKNSRANVNKHECVKGGIKNE